MAGGARLGYGRSRTWSVRVGLVALLLLAVWVIGSQWDELVAALRQAEPWTVPVALIPAALAMLTSFNVWRRLLGDIGTELPRRTAARVFFIAQLGKYAPGSVWSVLTQMELSRGHRVPRRSIAVVGVLAVVLSVTCGSILAVVAIPFISRDTAARYWGVWLALPVLVGLLHPAVLGRHVDWVLRRLGREPLPARPSGRGIAAAGAFQFGTWLLLGLHAWALLIGLGAAPLESLPVAIGGYALAYAAGQLAIGLPGGAGVRELALTAVMSTVLPVASALLLALLSRVILVAIDISLAGAQVALGAYRTARSGR